MGCMAKLSLVCAEAMCSGHMLMSCLSALLLLGSCGATLMFAVAGAMRGRHGGSVLSEVRCIGQTNGMC